MRTIFLLREGHAPWNLLHGQWWVNGDTSTLVGQIHELEEHRRISRKTDFCNPWSSEEELLEEYFTFYKLIPTEVTTDGG